MLQRPRGSGLALTLPQAPTLWALDESTCRELLERLVTEGFLCVRPDVRYVMRDREERCGTSSRSLDQIIQPGHPQQPGVAPIGRETLAIDGLSITSRRSRPGRCTNARSIHSTAFAHSPRSE